jgi:CRP-like cAMP-binding protein
VSQTFEPLLAAHPFFAGLDPAFVASIACCATEVRYRAGAFVFHEDESADRFFLLCEGHVLLQIAAPGRGAASFLTLGPGDVFGVNWMASPYRWFYDAKAVDPARALVLDAVCLRRKCEADHDLGYELMQRVLPVLIDRLHSCRLQLLDLYAARI